jgi:hypothetical protein
MTPGADYLPAAGPHLKREDLLIPSSLPKLLAPADLFPLNQRHSQASTSFLSAPTDSTVLPQFTACPAAALGPFEEPAHTSAWEAQVQLS